MLFIGSFTEMIDKVYSPLTKKYFHEVINSYDNGNYRSAVVMLYSVVIADLLLKLKELEDMYDDSVAKSILQLVNKNRENKEIKQKWETELINKIYRETTLIEDADYVNIIFLYSQRNLSAHPTLNINYDLFSPNRETVAAHIRNMLEGVLIKPPVFAKKITDMLLEDLESKKNIYNSDLDQLHKYLQNRYFEKTDDKMFCSVFKDFWKITLVLDNQECSENRDINKKCMLCMLKEREKQLLELIKGNQDFSMIANNDSTMLASIYLCARCYGLYRTLNEALKFQIQEFINKSEYHLFLVAWFTEGTFEAYSAKIKEKMQLEKYKNNIDRSILSLFKDYHLANGYSKELYDFNIFYFSLSYSFDTANSRYDICIKEILKDLSKEQGITLINAINDNSQIYGRNRNYTDNTEIVSILNNKLGTSFNYSGYRHFKFDESALNNNETEKADEDEINEDAFN